MAGRRMAPRLTARGLFMAPKNIKDISVALENFEKNTMGNKGKPRIRLFGDKQEAVEVIPFDIPASSEGSPTVDDATDVGGLPRGKIIEIFGPESSGKSWLGMKAGASAQRMGLRTAWLDIEFSLVPKWAARQGLDLNSMLFGNDFDCAEECLQYVLEMSRHRVADYIAIDSVAALVPKAVIEKGLDENTMAEVARLLSKSLNQITKAAGENGTTIVFINQVRDKVGVMFGNPETTPGGRALKFYSGMRIRTWRKTIEMDKKIGKPVRIISGLKIVKNKVGLPFQMADYAIEFSAESNSPLLLLVRKAVDYKLFSKKRGTTEFLLGDTKSGEPTGCEEISELSDWLQMEGRLLDIKAKLIEKAEKDKEKLPQSILDLDPANLKPVMPEVDTPVPAGTEENPDGEDPGA